MDRRGAIFPLRPILRLFLLGLLLVWMTVPARGEDRFELAQTMRLIPPNGPLTRYGDITFDSFRSGKVPAAIFPHWLHRARYTCRVCHQELKFAMSSGQTRMSRAALIGGKFCGACHNGDQAFSLRPKDGGDNCGRCHLDNREDLDKKFASFAEGLPEAEFGNGIDWAEAYAQNLVQPVDSLSGGRRDTIGLPKKLQKPLNLGTSAARSSVLFSHEEHYAEMDCANCHPDIFTIVRNGTEAFTMEKNIYGWYCGTCHMRVAFPMNDCHRCHPEMKNGRRF